MPTALITFDQLVQNLSGGSRCFGPVWVSLVKESSDRIFANLWTYSDDEPVGVFVKRIIAWAEEVLNDPVNESPTDYATALVKRCLTEHGDDLDVALEAEDLADVLMVGDVRLNIVLGEDSISIGLCIVGKDEASLDVHRVSQERGVR